jgi:hypothetical protein
VREFGAQPRLTVTTDLPPMPAHMGGGSPSAAAGGLVSSVGGGTLAQQTARIVEQTADLTRATQRVPLIPARGGGTVLELKVVIVSSGQTLDSGQTGVKYSSSAVTDVPSAYDPSVTSTFIDGIGRGTLYINGVAQSGYVLIRNDVNSPIQRALIAGDIVAVHEPTTVTVNGDANTTINVYPILFL